MVSAVETKFSGVVASSLSLFRRQRSGKSKGSRNFISSARCESAANGRVEWQLGAIDAVTLHDSKRQSQREGSVGWDARAQQREARLSDLRVSLTLDFLDFIFVALAQFPRRRIDQQCQADHGIGASLDGGLAPTGEVPAHGLGR